MAKFALEYHYRDKDVGVLPLEETPGNAVADDLNKEIDFNYWEGARARNNGHELTHIVIRPNNDEGQEDSNILYAAADMLAALREVAAYMDKEDNQSLVDQVLAAIGKAEGATCTI